MTTDEVARAAAGTDPFGLGPRTAIGAGPLLSAFNTAAILSAADVHVAQRLGRLCGEADERVLLAVALTVRAVRSGSVCVRLDDLETLAVPEVEDVAHVDDLPWPHLHAWQQLVRASTLVAVGEQAPDRPVRWVDGRLYLDRYWQDEQVVRRHVDARLTAPPAPVDAALLAKSCTRLFPARGDGRQRLAAAAAALGRLTVLTGGPGTGKTTTVARMLAVLQEAAGPQSTVPTLQVALAAPTGKAAARLQGAVREVVGALDPSDQRRVGLPEATTLHRLLGWRPGTSTRFRHDRDHHLPHDVVVVDETSMVSLPLMARLLEALRPESRLVLVGDPDQLASVEAGAVLGDLVARQSRHRTQPSAVEQVLADDVPVDPRDRSALRGAVVRLEVVHRHGALIGRLAAAVRAGDGDEALTLLRSGEPGLSFIETAADVPSDGELTDVRAQAQRAGVALVEAARSGDAPAALRALDQHRVLVAHRRGPAGVGHWSSLVEQWVEAACPALPRDASSDWYPGRPLLVTRNDRDTGLYNGDTGVVVAAEPVGSGRAPVEAAATDTPVRTVAAFGDPAQPMLVRPHRLPSVETVHAMTVHRAQGSQFSRVCLVLPPASSPLLTRELFYTAVTRAREAVCVVGTADAVRAAIERPVRRASGLRDD